MCIRDRAGIFPGTPEYETFFLVWQTLFDSADPINWAAEASANTPILLHEAINDQTIPNFVLTSPLAGTEPLIKWMGLQAYSSTQQSADGLRSAGRFVPPAEHFSYLSPDVGSPEAFVEMQKQAVSFIASFGGAVVVTDESTMVPVVSMQSSSIVDLTEKKSADSAPEKKKPKPISRRGSVSRLEQLQHQRQPDRFE